MAEKANFKETFQKLRAILEPYASKTIVVHDTDTNYYLDMDRVIKKGHRLFFAAVRSGKGYVSFHLMPVYASADLQQKLSPELKKRMQGKSCFNFKTVDEKLFKELAGLTKAGFATFNDPKFLEKIMR
jgi:hypothetical protein